MKHWFLCAAALLAFAPGQALADDPEGPFPITDPSYEPEVWGVGHEPGVLPAFDSPTVLFVNMDGGEMNGGCGNDSRNNCSTIIQGTITPFDFDDVKKASVIQAVRDDVEDFGVIAVGERPPAGNPYAMVMVGSAGDTGSVGGVAPGIDCGNTFPNITSFCFLGGSSNLVATVVHQEAAHTWGLEHVDDSTDNLYPTAGGTTDPKYQDVCSKIVSDTSLNPSNGQCNQVHVNFCNSGFQNSYQEMLLLFGPPVPDNSAPTVIIENPVEGQTLDYEEAFELIVTLDDDRRPQTFDTVIAFDGTAAITNKYINTTLVFQVPGGDEGHALSSGEHTISVEATDEWGNATTEQVTIIIENGPDGSGDGGDSGDSGGTEGSESGEGGQSSDKGGCRTTPHLGFGWLLLGAILVRRRVRSVD